SLQVYILALTMGRPQFHCGHPPADRSTCCGEISTVLRPSPVPRWTEELPRRAVRGDISRPHRLARGQEPEVHEDVGNCRCPLVSDKDLVVVDEEPGVTRDQPLLHEFHCSF